MLHPPSNPCKLPAGSSRLERTTHTSQRGTGNLSASAPSARRTHGHYHPHNPRTPAPTRSSVCRATTGILSIQTMDYKIRTTRTHLFSSDRRYFVAQQELSAVQTMDGTIRSDYGWHQTQSRTHLFLSDRRHLVP